MTKSGLADCNERRWNALLEWLKGLGMMVDEDHLLVRPKHLAGTCLPISRVVQSLTILLDPSRCREWSVCYRRHPCSCPNMLDNTRPTYGAVAVVVCSVGPRCLRCPARPKLI